MASQAVEKPARLRSNIIALGVVQLSNYVIPLITLPYLTRVLGPEAYGKIAYAQVVMAYLVLLTDYGFSWSASRKISAHRSDKAFISRVFMGTWTAQWLLVLLSAILALITITYSARLRSDSGFYIAAFSTVLGNALFPIWFLQGLERLQIVAALQLLTRVLALIPIFLFIKQPAHAVIVPAINGGGVILGGILSLMWIRYKNLVELNWPGWKAVIQELKEGSSLFSTRLAISLYTTLIPLTLGWFAGPVAVAYFALADKLRSAAQSLLGPLSQALYPRMSFLFATNKNAAQLLVKQSAWAVFFIAGSASLSLWIFAEHIIILIAGAAFLPAAKVLRWMAFCPLAIALSNLYGVQVLLAYGKQKIVNITAISIGLVSAILCWPITNFYQETGAAALLLISEIIVALVYYLASVEILKE